jgi:hypothetical protein
MMMHGLNNNTSMTNNFNDIEKQLKRHWRTTYNFEDIDDNYGNDNDNDFTS